MVLLIVSCVIAVVLAVVTSHGSLIPLLRLHCLRQDEVFLEDVNMILNTGDVPNLYEHDEKAEIIEKVTS